MGSEQCVTKPCVMGLAFLYLYCVNIFDSIELVYVYAYFGS